ncbi:PREDICTED: putative F-box protein At4g22660 [Camelina sativa]|uniref:F-box protein At4g22660 n=1 Tax=Camelina sativa TaxID=90675 RepID=A0ABM0U654_CAMSA|nr:PREDICTED: putative F-box protein At4g22660 [Camelina sativa]
MKKNHNPNSWSELPLDILNLVFERLSFANFQRAKSVCSSWYSASRQSVPKNQIPWSICFPEDNDNNSSCTLFNPEEKHKLYKTQDLGVEFHKSECIATYGSWLLMRDPRYNLYILNLFTHEKFNLPSVKSQLGTINLEKVIADWFLLSNDHNTSSKAEDIIMQSPVIWIDEKTKEDYIVLWGLRSWCVFYAKKGDTSWSQVPDISYCQHLVYKDHKLYSFSCKNILTILDFSGEIPQQTFRNPCLVDETKLVVTVTGDVLKVERMKINQSFRIYKVYSSSRLLKEYEGVYSLGDEAMILDLGITFPANDFEGFHRNSIYFCDRENTHQISIFDLETKNMKRLHNFDFNCSSSRWFLPSFTSTR